MKQDERRISNATGCGPTARLQGLEGTEKRRVLQACLPGRLLQRAGAIRIVEFEHFALEALGYAADLAKVERLSLTIY